MRRALRERGRATHETPEEILERRAALRAVLKDGANKVSESRSVRKSKGGPSRVARASQGALLLGLPGGL
eukprot:15471125-Alexandrium_andersonii.AAC.1